LGLPKLANDLVGLNVDVILTWGTDAVLAAKQATTTSLWKPLATPSAAALLRIWYVRARTSQGSEIEKRTFGYCFGGAPAKSLTTAARASGPSERMIDFHNGQQSGKDQD